MHELAHIVLHGRSHADIDVDPVGPAAVAEGEKAAAEQEADRQAGAWLVPPDELTRFITETSPYYSHDRIAGFAQCLGVHTGVVVGHLQHRGEIGWGHSRKFLVKVRHILPMES
jgi:HTH-type transcriptional regulator/antitoxin HigA